MGWVWQRLGFPDVGTHGRYVGALGIDALGSGIWMPMSLLYFLRESDIGLVQLGLVITIANAISFPATPLLGQLVDAWGPRRVLQMGNVVQALAFALYPLAHRPVSVGALIAVSTIGRSAFWAANGPMIAQITAPGERELWFGFVQAMRNVGYGVGGLLSALALGIGSSLALHAVVEANAASYVAAFVLMLGVRGGSRPPERGPGGGWGTVVRDRAFRRLISATFGYALAEQTLNVAIPVYIAENLGLPGWAPGTVFVINTVMIGFGQGLLVRRMTGRVRVRVMFTGVAFTAVGFAILWAADPLAPALALAAVLVAAVVYTLGEMTFGPVLAALVAGNAPDRLRGRYLSANQLAWTASSSIAPITYAALLHRGAGAMWGGGLLLCAAWAVAVLAVARGVPLARAAVTNQAEPVAQAAAPSPPGGEDGVVGDLAPRRGGDGRPSRRQQ